MRRRLSVRIGTLVLVAAMAMPAFAAPKRDDSPFDDIGRAVSSFIHRVIQILDLDLSQINPPK